MFKTIKKRIKNEKGLTLIELLAVIVILAIVAAIAVPAIGGIIENSRYKAVKADAINVISAANIYFTDNPNETIVSTGYLLNQGFLENSGKIPSDNAVSTNITSAPATVETDDSYVTKTTGGNAITTTEIIYNGTKTITFTGANITEINADNNKGNGAGGYTIQ